MIARHLRRTRPLSIRLLNRISLKYPAERRFAVAARRWRDPVIRLLLGVQFRCLIRTRPIGEHVGQPIRTLVLIQSE
jgi:hypothetical protein